MSSQIDRLINLLHDKQNKLITTTAGDQIGEISATQPNNIPYLFKKVKLICCIDVIY